MTIKNLARYGIAALMGILCIGGLMAALRIDEIRIGGPIATELQQVSDLVADILPPPEYLVEPYLEATLLVNKPDDFAARTERLAQLRKDYDARHRYWLESSLDPEVRKSVTEGSHDPAMRFWDELESGLLPAVQANDPAATAASYSRLSGHFAQHRAMVDKAVVLAGEQSAKLKDYAASQLKWAIILMAALAGSVLVFAGGFGLVILRNIVRPLVEVVDATTQLAHGGNVDVPHQARTDELGEIAKAIELFRDQLKKAGELAEQARTEQARVIVESIGTALEAMAEGDLTARVDAELVAPFDRLKANFNDAASNLSGLIGSVSESAAGIRTGSMEIAQASEDLARRTEGNAASIEETSAALVQIDGRLKAAAAASASTVQRADQAIATVHVGRTTADDAMQAMDRVSDSAKSIDSVIEGLDKIAFQTRVLAMNAAVEAGRAGDAGRGFAVVADLVSALATRAEEEARRARGQLTITQSEIGTAVEAVQRVDGALVAIAGDVDEVHKLLAGMAADNQAQSMAITDITGAVSSMDQSTQQNAAMVEETSAAARNLTTEVSSLAEQAATFKVDNGVKTRPAPVAATPVPHRPKKAAAYRAPGKALPIAANGRINPAANGHADGAASQDWQEF